MFVLLLDTASAPVSHRHMRSPLADAARRSLSDDVKRMTAEQRLAAFLAHCQLMAHCTEQAEQSSKPPRSSIP
jgi:hypothetical protein